MATLFVYTVKMCIPIFLTAIPSTNALELLQLCQHFHLEPQRLELSSQFRTTKR